MRRIVKIIAYIALVVLMQDSCQKIDNLSKAADSKKEEIEVQREVSVTSFYAYSGENDSKTKTSRKENGDLWWSPGDEIMVFCGEASGKFVSQNEESAEIATFVGSFDKDVSTSDVSANGVLAFYPYSDALTREGNSVVFTLPSSQLAVAGTFDDDLYPVIARSDTTELSFYNICGGAKFTVSKKGIKTVTIRGNDSEPLAGKLSVTLDENGIPIVEVVDGEKEIVVTAPDGSTLEVGKEYYIVTIPQCLKKGFTLIYNQGLNIYNEFQTTKSINIKRSKFGVLEDLDENLDIADWDDPIEFKSSGVEKICVTEWDTNGDGKLSYKEAALVQTIGTVFQSKSSILDFDELKYFTGLTSISSGAFSGCSGLQSVTIPSSVTSIGDNAFSGCSGLKSVIIPSSVTSIGSAAFSSCSGLKSVTIPSSVTSIGDYTFSGCSSLQSVTIPSSVTSIGSHAFSYCSGLQSVTIPSSVTSIGGSAFSYCSGLKSVTIPSSVTSIGNYAFLYCDGLKSVTIPSSVTSIGGGAFYGCRGDLYVNCNIPSYSSSIGNPFFNSEFTSLVIGEGVTSIGDYAFSDCSILQSVTIPSSVTSIGSRAFSGCSGGDLLYLYVNCDIPSYSSINESPFYNGKFTILVIGEGVTSIGKNAFCRSGLQSVTIPSSVTSIGEDAFSGCGGDLYVNCNIPSYSSFTESPFYHFINIVIGEGVTSIGDNAFYRRSGSVTIPSSVTSIGPRAFYGCGGALYVNCDIPSYSSINESPFFNSKFTSLVIGEGVTSIGDNAFYGCSGLQSVTIPSSVTSIGEDAFYGCGGALYVNCDIPSYYYDFDSPFYNGIFTSLVIGEGVTSIGDYAFYGCSGLQSVTIPSSVTSIGEDAFYGCSGLQSVTIPENVTLIHGYAFGECENLKTVFFKAETPPAISRNAFDPIPDGFIIYVPYSSLDSYLDSWGVFSSFLRGYAF